MVYLLSFTSKRGTISRVICTYKVSCTILSGGSVSLEKIKKLCSHHHRGSFVRRDFNICVKRTGKWRYRYSRYIWFCGYQ